VKISRSASQLVVQTLRTPPAHHRAEVSSESESMQTPSALLVVVERRWELVVQICSPPPANLRAEVSSESESMPPPGAAVGRCRAPMRARRPDLQHSVSPSPRRSELRIKIDAAAERPVGRCRAPMGARRPNPRQFLSAHSSTPPPQPLPLLQPFPLPNAASPAAPSETRAGSRRRMWRPRGKERGREERGAAAGYGARSTEHGAAGWARRREGTGEGRALGGQEGGSGQVEGRLSRGG